MDNHAFKRQLLYRSLIVIPLFEGVYMIRGRKLVYGVGLNDANYPVTAYQIGSDGKDVQVWVCPFYKRWRSMLQRCYDPKTHQRYPTYIDCLVCEEWLTFSKFKFWMEKQPWEGMELDKDIIVPGNKLYSPEYCCFVTPDLNKFVLDRFAARGNYPIGVSWHVRRNKFQANCKNPLTKRQEYLGLYSSPEQAHAAWKKRKHEISCELAEMQSDERVKEILLKLFL